LSPLLFASVALAEMPFPSWKDAQSHEMWTKFSAELSAHCPDAKFMGQAVTCDDPRQVHALIDRAQTFEDVVCPDGGLEYLVALAHRYLGENTEAEAHYRKATALSPDDFGAWNDLGEMMVLEGNWAEAKTDYTHVSELLANDPRGWTGPWRLAEVAANQHDAATFEDNIREALRRGFSFKTIAGLPNWQRFYADPALHDSIEKLITVYGDRKTLESLQASP
jgi:tetratricopeptide (TPR) repeat protein